MACETCNEQGKGTCKEYQGTDCIYTDENLPNSGVKANTVLTVALKRIDEYIAQLKENITSVIRILNIGGGARLYKGINNNGEHELRTIESSDSTVTITENSNTIDLTVELQGNDQVPNATETVAGIASIATQQEAQTGTNDSKIITPLKLKGLLDEVDTDYTIGVTGNNIILYEDGQEVSSGTVEIPEGDSVTEFIRTGTELTIVTQSGNTFTADISEVLEFTQIQADFTQENATSTSYIRNRNPNKTVYANYIIQPSDNNYVIVIDSNAPVVITVPSSLPDKHATGFIQKGTGLVTIANVDILPQGTTNTIRGRGHQAFIEKIEGTTFLLGNLNTDS